MATFKLEKLAVTLSKLPSTTHHVAHAYLYAYSGAFKEDTAKLADGSLIMEASSSGSGAKHTDAA